MKLTNKIKLSESNKIKDGIIEKVHVLGFKSLNGYSYKKEAVKEAMAMYENAPVYLNHDYRRRVEDKMGFLSGITFNEDTGLWADKLTLNTGSPHYEAIKFWGEKAPSQIGLSHSVEASINRDEQLVTKIDSVESVDIVSAPATTKGLHESATFDEKKKQLDFLLSDCIEGSREHLLNSPSYETDIAKLIEDLAVKLKGKPIMELKDVTLAMLQESRKDLVEAIAKPAAEAAAKTASATEIKISEALAKVPADKQSDIFKKQIRDAIADDKTVADLIADRLAIIKETPVTTTGGTKTEESKDKALSEDEIRKLY